MEVLLWIVLAYLCIRLMPVLVRPRAKSYDTLFHLYYARRIKLDGAVPLVLDRTIPEYPLAYPYLFHRLLALFPLAWHPFVERLFPALFDTALLILVILLANFVNDGQPCSAQMTVYAALLFTFQPALIRYDGGPRLHYGSPRIMGQLVYNAHILALYYAWMTGSLGALGLGIAAGICIFFSAKFTIQVAVFFSIPLMLFVSLWYGLLLFVCWILGCVFSRGRLMRDMKYFYAHYTMYATQLQQRFLHKYYISAKAYLYGLSTCVRNSVHAPKALFMYIYWGQRNPLNNLVFLYPESLVFVLALLSGTISAWYPLGLIPLTATVCMFTIEGCKSLMFLGEGERYMQYASPILCVLAGQAFVHLSPFIMALYCVYGFIFFLAGMIAFWLLTKNMAYDGNGLQCFFAKVNAEPAGNILCVGNFGWHCLYYGTQPFYAAPSPSIKSDDVYFEPLYTNYPLPSGDLEALFKRFSVTYILTDTTHLARYKALMPNPDVFAEHCVLLHQMHDMLLYKVA